MNHELRIKESFANAIVDGRKKFEVRWNDRGYQTGDTVTFNVYKDGEGVRATGHPIQGKTYRIGYVLSGWGLKNGYVAFGIEPI